MKLSIITINYNNANGLKRTIESVVSQRCQDFEYIVIDGGSTDGSVDIIKKYADKIDYWVSEKDEGIYNAMNKGTREAHGNFCQYLNSGDWLFDENVIEKVIPYLDNSIDIGGGITHVVNPNTNGAIIPAPIQLSSLKFITDCLYHQAMFIRRVLLLERPYREDYKIVSDWIFFLESYLYSNIRYKRLDVDTVYYDETGISSIGSSTFEEKRKFLSSIAPEKMINDFALIPIDVFDIYSELTYSFRLKKILSKIVRAIVAIYIFIKNVNAKVGIHV